LERGGTGGLFWECHLVLGISESINKHMDNTNGTSGSPRVHRLKNNHRVAAGQMTLGLSSSSTLYEAKRPRPV